jgi:hypothetical protein
MPCQPDGLALEDRLALGRAAARMPGQQGLPLEERLAEEAKRLREEAKLLPPGARREQLLRKARQAETGSRLSEWLRSPGLQTPR